MKHYLLFEVVYIKIFSEAQRLEMEPYETGKIRFVFSFTAHPEGGSTVVPSFLSIK